MIATQATDVHDAITAANDEFMKRIEDGNAAGLAGLYTNDGQLLAPGSDVVQGRAAIGQYWEGAASMGVRRVKLQTVDLFEGAEMVSETGRYTLFAEGDQVIDRGKYIVLWKQEDGMWKMHRDMYNTSVPPQG